ncbi:hypothetical protein [Azospirillum doebereinerae]|uniref:Uncharacterized protein n=2 Tax=Azospirillum doebereinerae TaxID=92933 RepID=A0A3S0UXK8_9PROT|nr:hypothetical protein EJ913_31245 [Azospirillum doebereinerae]
MDGEAANVADPVPVAACGVPERQAPAEPMPEHLKRTLGMPTAAAKVANDTDPGYRYGGPSV